MLALARYIPAYHQAATQGAWSQSEQFCLLDYPITELAGKTFAVVGYGNLGQASAKLAAAIGMKLLIAERPDTKTIREGRVSFEQALAEADVLSLHCPLTPNTQYLMNAARLQQMKPSALLINTARGALVEPHDLILALQAGWIAGAALDVLSVEPPSADHILLQTRLPNLIITPHIAWASQTARQKLIQQLAQIIQAFQQGERINAIV